MASCDIANVRLSRSLSRNALIPVTSFLLKYASLSAGEKV
jgi:hypothetical protein